MDIIEFSDRMNVLAARVRDFKEHATTEESTKAALINPFLQALGYDTSDPRTVCFEFAADIGTKKGEKVDYAIKREDEIILLIEAKKVGTPLDSCKASQLHRYFHNTSAHIAILTDGVRYEFFSDLDKDNIMDEKPFMIFDFDKLDEKLIPELYKLANANFNVDTALAAAQDLKHMRQIKLILRNEFNNPSEEFIRIFASKILNKPLRANVIEEFSGKVKMACSQYLNEELINRVQGVTIPSSIPTAPVIEEEEKPVSRIVTTEEEVEAYMIVKSILRTSVPLSRVAMRDTQSYCGILFDDNNRKPICRFYFNSAKVKYIAVFEEKTEIKIKIESVDDIFEYSEAIIKFALQYVKQETGEVFVCV